MILIDPNTRQFNVPGAELVFGVESDAGSERKWFQCPRYVGDNLDLASCFVRMNYRNANGEMDSYLVDDVTIDGSNVTFSWVLSQKAVMYKGQVKFVVCAVGPNQKVEWHTTLGAGMVLEGLEPDAAVVEAGTADVVAQLIAMVEAQTAAVENKGAEWVRNVQSEGTDQVIAVQTAARDAQTASVAQIEAKGASTLATIPGEYTATVRAVQSAANAIRKKVSGEVIRVDDVSPMEHYPEIRVSSKNLMIPNHASYTSYGYVVTLNDDGGVTVSGSANNETSIYLSLALRTGSANNRRILLKAGHKYIMSAYKDGEAKTVNVRTIYADGTTTWKSSNKWHETDDTTQDREVVQIYVESNGHDIGDTSLCGTYQVQLEEGEVATGYTPYVDPTTVTVTRCGKNLISVEGFTLNQTNGKGEIENGVLTATGYLLSCRVPGQSLVGRTCVVSCESTRTGERGGGLSVEFRNKNNERLSGIYKQDELSPAFSFTVPKDTAGIAFFLYASGSKDESGTATYKKVQVEVGDTVSDYETYIGETQIPTSDGTVSGLTSVSPTMTLLTDTAGVNIECEYSRDTNVVIAEILEKITALGG